MSGIRIVSAVAVIIALLGSPSFAQELSKDQGYLGKFVVSAEASSEQEMKFPSEYAFDGNMKTRWSSEWNDDEWIACKFDQPVLIRKIQIYWENARSADYTLQTTRDGTAWFDLASRKGASGEVDIITFDTPVQSAGIKLRNKKRATEWGYSIYEIEFYGDATTPAPARNLIAWEIPPSQWQMRERKIAKLLTKVANNDPPTAEDMTDDEFIDLIEKRAFDYFWWETNPSNGLTKDRARSFTSSEEITHASVAACGFALTAYAVGVERGWTEHEGALERVKTTLRTFAHGPVRHDHGFFPHFVSYFSGKDTMGTEISTIDTALFLAGMITAMEYFDDPEIQELGKLIFDRVDWAWAMNRHPTFVTHGVGFDGKFLGSKWGSFSEGILIYLIGIGSETHPLSAKSWYAIDRHIGEWHGYRFVAEYGFQSIFRYQYPALWFDFRGRTDRTGIDYFNNATIATLCMREYCLEQADRFPKSYGPDMWGLGASDGPGNRYYIYGFPPGDPYSPVDGTIVLYAVAGSMQFLPIHATRSLRYIYDEHHDSWGKYGFTDSINPGIGFLASDVIGIDMGTILMSIENYRTGLPWQLFMRNKWVRNSVERIGWTSDPASPDPMAPIDLAGYSTWRFLAADGAFQSRHLNDDFWQDVLVPERWEYLDPLYREFSGVGWYRLTFDIDKERLLAWKKSGRTIGLRIGGIDDSDRTYVNGSIVGQTRSQSGSFRKERRYVVPSQLLRTEENVIAIRVDDTGGKGGIWLSPVQIGPVYQHAKKRR